MKGTAAEVGETAAAVGVKAAEAARNGGLHGFPRNAGKSTLCRFVIHSRLVRQHMHLIATEFISSLSLRLWTP